MTIKEIKKVAREKADALSAIMYKNTDESKRVVHKIYSKGYIIINGKKHSY